MNKTITMLLLGMNLLTACGGGGVGGSSNSDSPVPSTTPQVLAKIASGGATEISLENGSVVFTDYNRGKVLQVSSNGGEIKTLYANSFSSPGRIVRANGKVFVLNTQTAGGVFSIPEDATGVSTLFEETTNTSWPRDISCNGTYFYWSSGPNVYRSPLVNTSRSVPESVYIGSSGSTTRMVLDGDHLYITDSASRKLFLITTNTLSKTELLSFPGVPPLSIFNSGIPLGIDKAHIYVLVDNKDIHRIEKANPHDFIAATHTSIADIVADQTGVYWWESSGGNNLSLKKIDSASGSTTILLTTPFTWFPDAFISDGSNLYWFEHENDPVGDLIYRIYKVSINGGNKELVASYTSVVNIGGALLPRSVTIDADNIYWSSSATNLIVKLSKSGGSPVTVTGFDYYTAITAIDGFILAANNTNVIKTPINGVTPAASEWSQPSMSSSMPEEMANDESNLYWVVNNMGTGTNVRGQFDVFSKPMDGTTAKRLTTVPGTVTRLYPYGDSLYLLESANGSGSIGVIPKTGGDEKILVQTAGYEPTDIQIIGNTLYFLANGVRSLNLNTGEVKTLVQQGSTNRIYVDDFNIYWTQASGIGGGLFRIPVAGGTMQKLYDGASWKVTGDNIRVYWATGFAILSMQK